MWLCLSIAPTSFVVPLSSIDRLVAWFICFFLCFFFFLVFVHNQCALPASHHLLCACQLGRIAIDEAMVVVCCRAMIGFDWKSLGSWHVSPFIFRYYILHIRSIVRSFDEHKVIRRLFSLYDIDVLITDDGQTTNQTRAREQKKTRTISSRLMLIKSDVFM